MSHELLSTRPPSRLRVVGFLLVAAGAAAAGIGATREWVAIGFPADVVGSADVSVRGSDVWEGKAVLLAAAAALFALLAMRLAGSAGTRRGLALLLMGLGLVALALPVFDGIRAGDRFGGRSGVDRMVESLAAELELPEEVVRQQLTEQFEAQLRVEVRPALWVSAAGGLCLVAGGLLGLAWARRREASPTATTPPEPA